MNASGAKAKTDDSDEPGPSIHDTNDSANSEAGGGARVAVATTVAAAVASPSSTPPRRSRSGKRKRTHKRKDAPSRPLSAYNLFFREERHAWMRERTEGSAAVGGGDTSKPSATTAAGHSDEEDDPDSGDINPDKDNMAAVVGARWKKLTAEQRQPFVELAAKDQQRYRQEMDVYREKLLRETAIGTAYLERQNKPGESGSVATASTTRADGTSLQSALTSTVTGSLGDGAARHDEATAVVGGAQQLAGSSTDLASIHLGRPSIGQWLDQQQLQTAQEQPPLAQQAFPSNSFLQQASVAPTTDHLQRQLLLLSQAAQFQSLQQPNPMHELALQQHQHGQLPQQGPGVQELLFLLQQQQQQQQFQTNSGQLHSMNSFQNVLQGNNPMISAVLLQQEQQRQQQMQMQNMLGLGQYQDNAMSAALGESSNHRQGPIALTHNAPTQGGGGGGLDNEQDILRRALEAAIASPTASTNSQSQQNAHLGQLDAFHAMQSPPGEHPHATPPQPPPPGN